MVLAFLKNVNSLFKYQIASTMSCGIATTTATHSWHWIDWYFIW